MKKYLLVGITVMVASTSRAQVPDPRDSIILESKTVAAGLSGHPAFTMKVYITNKDTLAILTLALKESTTVGTGYVVLDSIGSEFDPGWTLADCVTFLKSTLRNFPAEDFQPYDGTSPDRFLIAAGFNPSGPLPVRGSEPPNSVRTAIWELHFMSTTNGPTTIVMDTSASDTLPGTLPQPTLFTILKNYGRDIADIPVNFLPSVIQIRDDAPVINCPCVQLSALHGQPLSYDFNADRPGSWSMVSGPGSIDPASGIYSFSGDCSLLQLLPTVRMTSEQGVSADCQFIINATDRAPSCSPVQSTVTVLHGQTATNQISASDPDAGDGLAFSQLSGPGSVNAGGAWSYTTGCADVAASPQTVRIKTSDAFGVCNPGPLSDTCAFLLVVTNTAPSITNCPPDVFSIDPGTAFSLQLSAFDADLPDGGNLIFNLVSGPAGFSVSSSGLVEWTPTASQGGLQSATVQVLDLCGATSNCQLNFAVSVKGDMNGDFELRPADLVLHLNCVFLGAAPQELLVYVT